MSLLETSELSAKFIQYFCCLLKTSQSLYYHVAIALQQLLAGIAVNSTIKKFFKHLVTLLIYCLV